MRCNRLSLLSIRECVEMLGGVLTIESAPGKRATLHTVVPVTGYESIGTTVPVDRQRFWITDRQPRG